MAGPEEYDELNAVQVRCACWAALQRAGGRVQGWLPPCNARAAASPCRPAGCTADSTGSAQPASTPKQMFHDRRRFKVNLASLCGHSQEVITGAELLHLAQPGVQAARLDAQPPPVVPWGGGGSEYDSEEEEGGWQDEGEEEEEEEGPWPPGQASPWAPDQEMEVHLVRGSRGAG